MDRKSNTKASLFDVIAVDNYLLGMVALRIGQEKLAEELLNASLANQKTTNGRLFCLPNMDI